MQVFVSGKSEHQCSSLLGHYGESLTATGSTIDVEWVNLPRQSEAQGVPSGTEECNRNIPPMARLRVR